MLIYDKYQEEYYEVIPVEEVKELIEQIKKEEKYCRDNFEEIWAKGELTNYDKSELSKFILLEQEIGAIKGMLEKLIKENTEEE